MIAHSFPLEFIYAIWLVCYGLVPLTFILSVGGYLMRRRPALLVCAGVAGLQLLWGVLAWVTPRWGGGESTIVMTCVGIVNAAACVLVIWHTGHKNQTRDAATTQA
jgi:hypothetical protein